MNSTMNNDDRVSALIDNELSIEESQEVLDLVMRDPALRERWQRYHRIRDALQGYTGSSDRVYTESVNAAVSAQIASVVTENSDAEIVSAVKPVEAKPVDNVANIDRARTKRQQGANTDFAPKQQPGSDLWPWASGFAVAATVAAVVIFGLRLGEVGPSIPGVDDRTVVAVSTPAAVDSWDRRVDDRNLRWKQSGERVVSGDQNRLNALLVRHGEFVSVSGMNGLSGYARFVSFDERSR